MSLTRLNLILLPSVLVLASPTWAEARQVNAKTPQARPLNLSLPRDVKQAPGAGQADEMVDETVQRNLLAPAPDDVQAPSRMRYGTGYEHRHQEMGGTAVGGAAAGGAGAGSAAGSGRRGR